jgi:hypothetical protein
VQDIRMLVEYYSTDECWEGYGKLSGKGISMLHSEVKYVITKVQLSFCVYDIDQLGQ